MKKLPYIREQMKAHLNDPFHICTSPMYSNREYILDMQGNIHASDGSRYGRARPGDKLLLPISNFPTWIDCVTSSLLGWITTQPATQSSYNEEERQLKAKLGPDWMVSAREPKI